MEPTEMTMCGNCAQSFASDRIELHEAYCFRHIRKCEKCNKMVDVKEQSEHDKEYHVLKPCEVCKELILPTDFKHWNICPKQLQYCNYCELEWPRDEFYSHQEICGARTSKCAFCNLNIPFKKIEEHERICEKKRINKIQISQEIPLQRIEFLGNRPDEYSNRSSNNKISKPRTKINLIEPERIREKIDTVPISIRVALRAKEIKSQMKSKN